MSRSFVVAWSKHPNLIPMEVGCIVPEPMEPSVVGQLLLFLQEGELIHSKQDMLQLRAFIQVLEVHDFSILDIDISEDSSSERDPDDYPQFDQG
jgi:hypothetical protein